MENNYETIEYSSSKKTTTLLLCLFFGCFGVHQFYTKHYAKGIIYLLTLGLFFIGWVVDLALIITGRFKDANGLPLKMATYDTDTVPAPHTVAKGISPRVYYAGIECTTQGKASIGMIQRKLTIGFSAASEILQELETLGVVGPETGTTPRKVFMSTDQFRSYFKPDYSLDNTDTTVGSSAETTPSFTRPQYDYMDGHTFEHFCAKLLKQNGYSNVEVTQGSGDHGVDILAQKGDITYAIQCKCYSSNNVGNDAVQQVFSGKSFYKKDIAVVLTNQYFTQQAKAEATNLGVKLWDRDRLEQMIDFAELFQ